MTKMPERDLFFTDFPLLPLAAAVRVARLVLGSPVVADQLSAPTFHTTAAVPQN